jgi:glycosyltransferase involved in cell wall biosynthesis
VRIAVDGYEITKPVTGVGRIIVNLLPYLADSMPEHEFFMLSRESTALFTKPNITWQTLPSDTGYFRWQNGPLRKKLKKVRPDILLAFNYTLPLFGREKTILFEYDVSFAAHSEWFPKKEAIKRKCLVRRSMKKCDQVVTISFFSKSEIMKYFPVKDEKLHVVHLGVEERFHDAPLSAVREWKESQGLKDKKIIGYLGSIFNRRHIPELVESIALLRQQVPDVVLFIIGKDLTYPSLDMDKILCLDWIKWELDFPDEKLPIFYSSLEAFAYLSEYEGFGLPPLEALACGTVPVLLNKTALKEIFGDMAIMVEEPEALRIKAGLETALCDQAYRETLLKRFSEVRSRFSWKNTARDVREIIRKFL